MVDLASYSSPGGRDYNEDSVSVWDGQTRQCIIVADGLGGHGGGQIASQTAAGIVTGAFEQAAGIDEAWIQTVFSQANEAVLSRQTENCRMKTTCVSLFVENGQALWAHLGDSRLYHFVNGQIVFFTTDHSVSQMAVLSGEITKEQIRFHEDRNRVLRALGADAAVKPDFGSARLTDADFHAFLLCSDGFWEYVLEGEMEIDLSKSRTASEWIGYMTDRLEKKVDGRNDNYTAAAMFYDSAQL